MSSSIVPRHSSLKHFDNSKGNMLFRQKSLNKCWGVFTQKLARTSKQPNQSKLAGLTFTFLKGFSSTSGLYLQQMRQEISREGWKMDGCSEE